MRSFGSILGQTLGSSFPETSPPQHNGDPGCLQPPSNSTVRKAVRGQQSNPRSKNDPLRGSLGTHPSLQLNSILHTHGQRDRFVSHAIAVPQLALCVQLFLRQNTRCFSHCLSFSSLIQDIRSSMILGRPRLRSYLLSLLDTGQELFPSRSSLLRDVGLVPRRTSVLSLDRVSSERA